MKSKEMHEIGGLFSKVLQNKEKQGYAVRTWAEPNYNNELISELTKLENGNIELNDELRAVSVFIRTKLWKDNSKELYYFLRRLNNIFQLFSGLLHQPLVFNFEFLIEYIRLLASRRDSYHCSIDTIKFEELIDKVISIRNGKVIKDQWNNVLSGGLDTFIEVFDDAFSTVFTAYPDAFFISLKHEDILSRCVVEKSCTEDRFVPWPNKVHNNRWNPPGKTYLYTALKEQKIENCPSDLSGGEYICLHECRIEAETDVCFCDFMPECGGKILDLSYNDVSLYQFRHMIDEECDRNADGILSVLLNDQVLFTRRDDEDYVKTRIEAEMKKHPTSERVLMVSIAKQYLKEICDCIYSKVDEKDEKGKERAYKSFHTLANYLELKGVAGIVYPCTRLAGMAGKNIVLFNIHEAKPVKSSIRPYHNRIDYS